MGAADRAVPLGERGHDDLGDVQVVEADGHRADVDDGVDGSHLVKHHGLGRGAVRLRLGLGELSEHGVGEPLGALAHGRGVDDRADVRERAVLVMMMVRVIVLRRVLVIVCVFVLVLVRVCVIVCVIVIVLVCVPVLVIAGVEVAVEPGHVMVVVLVRGIEANVKVAGVQPALPHAGHGHVKAVGGQRRERLAQVLLARAEVEQRRDGHVSADAGTAVKVEGLAHGAPIAGRPPGGRRWSAPGLAPAGG